MKTAPVATFLAFVLAVGLVETVQAQDPAVGAQILGPQWQGQHIDVRGFVIAWDGNCRQVAVERDGIEGAGGRVWACYATGMSAPDLGEEARVHGVVSDTRMTRMGPRWRVVPVVEIRAKR